LECGVLPREPNPESLLEVGTDLAAATGTGQITTGAPTRSQRTATYNRLMKIEDELGASATFEGSALYSAASVAVAS